MRLEPGFHDKVWEDYSVWTTVGGKHIAALTIFTRSQTNSEMSADSKVSAVQQKIILQ